jgi:hypothetical protein
VRIFFGRFWSYLEEKYAEKCSLRHHAEGLVDPKVRAQKSLLILDTPEYVDSESIKLKIGHPHHAEGLVPFGGTVNYYQFDVFSINYALGYPKSVPRVYRPSLCNWLMTLMCYIQPTDATGKTLELRTLDTTGTWERITSETVLERLHSKNEILKKINFWFILANFSHIL